MALVKPFRALRYETGAAGSLDELVAPPHDVITPELRGRLLARSPYNVVRLIRPDDPEDAARLLAEWSEEGVLVREERPAVWLVEDEYTDPGGARRVRRGLAARVRLTPYSERVVLPHERTFARPKERRLQLLRATRTKLSPIFLLHEGTAPEPEGRPDLEAELDGVRTRVWRLEDATLLDLIEGQLVIADGHHRYETALRFHEEERSEKTAHVLAVLVGWRDPGLTIFPTHRLVAGAVPDLDGRFRLTALGDPGEAAAALGGVPRDHAAFVVLRRGGATLAEAERAALDTAVVDELQLEGVTYTASLADAERAVAAGAASAAFLVRPPTVQQVEAAARAGERMPPKSTYFYPKLTCGLLFSPLDE